MSRRPLFPDGREHPLLHAAESGDLASVERLLATLPHLPTSLDEPTADGWTPLIMAAKEGHTAVLEVLLAAGASANPRDDESHSALRASALGGHTDTCRRLLSAGAEVNQMSAGRRTALMGAAMNGHAETVALLCASGADPSLRNDFDEDAAALAARSGSRACVEEVEHASVVPVVIASATQPSSRVRADSSNQPEMRRNSILERLISDGARRLLVRSRGSAALDAAVTLGILAPSKLRLIRQCHDDFASEGSNHDLVLAEPGQSEGLVPFFFVRRRPVESAPLALRIAWHATDSLTPLYPETLADLEADASVVMRASELLLNGCPLAYVLTTHPGHHASEEHYGGYCFVNWACMLMASLTQAGRRPFLVDVDYHAGDGSAAILVRPEDQSTGGTVAYNSGVGPSGCSRSFISLHALNDYPFVPIEDSRRWAVGVPPGAGWDTYEPLLRGALARVPEDCDVLVVSLGFDTLAGDPEAEGNSVLALSPDDFGAMARLLGGPALPMCVIQEGGYKMSEIPVAASRFWAAASSTVLASNKFHSR